MSLEKIWEYGGRLGSFAMGLGAVTMTLLNTAFTVILGVVWAGSKIASTVGMNSTSTGNDAWSKAGETWDAALRNLNYAKDYFFYALTGPKGSEHPSPKPV